MADVNLETVYAEAKAARAAAEACQALLTQAAAALQQYAPMIQAMMGGAAPGGAPSKKSSAWD